MPGRTMRGPAAIRWAQRLTRARRCRMPVGKTAPQSPTDRRAAVAAAAAARTAAAWALWAAWTAMRDQRAAVRAAVTRRAERPAARRRTIKAAVNAASKTVAR